MSVTHIKSLAATALALSMSVTVHAQKANWQNLDLQQDTVFGISTEKAYATLLKDKKPHPVIVAIIDGGVDTAHEDLRQVLWSNPKEVPGNGVDDDHDGYIDDVHGWDLSEDQPETSTMITWKSHAWSANKPHSMTASPRQAPFPTNTSQVTTHSSG
jgi:hypothetical protein